MDEMGEMVQCKEYDTVISPQVCCIFTHCQPLSHLFEEEFSYFCLIYLTLLSKWTSDFDNVQPVRL